MTSGGDISGYHFADGAASHSHDYLLPGLAARLTTQGLLPVPTEQGPVRAFDLGCGNGFVADWLRKKGFAVAGCDPSTEGIALARATYPDLDLQIGSAYDDLRSKFGVFRLVVSLEVVEHVYSPRTYAKTMFDLLEPGGTAIVSTPYHGFLKNLAIVATGKFESHFNPLWDHGHIKFWTMGNLKSLFSEAGFVDIAFDRVGRIPVFAKSMIATMRRPRG